MEVIEVVEEGKKEIIMMVLEKMPLSTSAMAAKQEEMGSIQQVLTVANAIT